MTTSSQHVERTGYDIAIPVRIKQSDGTNRDLSADSELKYCVISEDDDDADVVLASQVHAIHTDDDLANGLMVVNFTDVQSAGIDPKHIGTLYVEIRITDSGGLKIPVPRISFALKRGFVT